MTQPLQKFTLSTVQRFVQRGCFAKSIDFFVLNFLRLAFVWSELNKLGMKQKFGHSNKRDPAPDFIPSIGAVAAPDISKSGDWRRRCLFLIMFGLIVLITLNLAITLWILKVMEFSVGGIGLLAIVPGGLQMKGQALVLDLLRSSTIRSRHGQPIVIETARNFELKTVSSPGGSVDNSLSLGEDKLHSVSSAFRVVDTHGANLFSVTPNEVALGVQTLRIEGEGGSIFNESIQTPLVRAEAGRDLRLESSTQALQFHSAQEISIQSKAGVVDSTSLRNMSLQAVFGHIRFDSPNVEVLNLQIAKLGIPGKQTEGYQVCSCASGKIFLADANDYCLGDESTTCRL